MGISTLLTIYFVIFSSSILHGVVPVKAKLLNHIHCFEYVENVADLKTYICKNIEHLCSLFIKLFCALGFGMDANFLLARTLVCLFFHSTTILSAVSAWPQQDMKNKMKREDMKRIYRFLHDKHHYFQRPHSLCIAHAENSFFSHSSIYSFFSFVSGKRMYKSLLPSKNVGIIQMVCAP